jgi:predicted alpha-1,2-mannosidase
MKIIDLKKILIAGFASVLLVFCSENKVKKDPVDYVNPYMGNISHMLKPTRPVVHLPNGMVRMFPYRYDHTGNRMSGFTWMTRNHVAELPFNLTPHQGDESGISSQMWLSYDQEEIAPYRYQVRLDELDMEVDYAPTRQSAIFNFELEKEEPVYLVFKMNQGKLVSNGNAVSGYLVLNEKTKLYLYAESSATPEKTGIYGTHGLVWGQSEMTSENLQTPAVLAVMYPQGTKKIGLRYGVSLISEEQAKKNLDREITGFDIEKVAQAGRDTWNEMLGRIAVEGGTEDDKTVFYTSLYRNYVRPVDISEDGKYFSAYDGQIHDAEGRGFYVDDAFWDNYIAAHPLRVLIDKQTESDILHSNVMIAQQNGDGWFPTFPGMAGDSRGMNSNHGVISVLDAWVKGLRGFDLEKAYLACKNSMEERSMLPFSRNAPAGILEQFYKEKGYYPSLKKGEIETVQYVNPYEKRQPIAVTLGMVYDQWALSQIARELGRNEEADYYLKCSYNYLNVFHPETKFFHPKDVDGNWIPDLDYRFAGGQGARDYYDENNGYIYRWCLKHNIADLVTLIGGKQAFIDGLEDMYNTTDYGMERWHFYDILPDHTGNVGMFSMANEPAFHIPYLYNYVGEPWRTQKRIRNLFEQWFRNDLMGIPGDEDGGGMSAFIVFSQLGFYPVTAGSPTYNIGSPVFSYVKMNLDNGKFLEIKANNVSSKNKYIQSAKLNGQPLDQAWFNHSDIAEGGILEFEMGPVANKLWAAAGPPPPSQGPMPEGFKN